MFAGDAQFIFQAVAYACEKYISSIYIDLPANHRLADLFKLHQNRNLIIDNGVEP